MAWCRSCERYLTPTALTTDGACPSCGADVDHAAQRPEAAAERIPWHFWLLVTAAAVYLGWRAVQGIALLL